jgi:hypothetical protein
MVTAMQPTMNSMISLTARQLDDPLLLEWALERYLEIPEAETERRQDVIAAFFHD